MRRFLIASVALAAILAGCSSEDSKQPAGPKPLVMGTQPDFPPFEHLGGASGEDVIGFDVDVAKAIAAKLGRPLQIEQLKFDALIPALNAGKIDMAVSGMTITDERAKNVEFTDPYYKATQVLIVRSDFAAPKSKEELKGKKIAVQLGTTGNSTAEALTGPANVVPFTTCFEAVIEVKTKKMDYLVLDEQPSMNFVKQNADLQLVRLDFADEFYGIALKKGATDLRAQINKALAELQADGTYDKLIAQHMK